MITKTYNSERTAGLTSQAAVEAIGNRYDLILIAARRVRELGRNAAAKVDSEHSPTITAMLEIEAGKIGREYLLKEQNINSPHRRHR